MSIQVLVFASLSEQLGLSQAEIKSVPEQTVQSIWDQLSPQQPDGAVRVAINQQYAEFDSIVNDGDEVAFFPPVTGG